MALSRITANSIQDGTVVAADIADGAVTGPKLGATSINANNIVNSSITSAKIVSVANTQITGNITSSQIVPNPTFNGNTTVTNLIVGAGSNTAPSIAPIGNANTGIYFPAADNIAITTGGTARLNVNATGQVTTPTQVGFMAYISTNQSISTGTETKIDLNTESYDIGSVFNTSTGTFTAPIAGRYLVLAAVSMAGAEAIHCGIWVNGVAGNATAGVPSAYLQMSDLAIADSTQQAIVNMRILNLSANDYVNLYTFHASGTSKNAVAERCFLNIMLLG